MNITKNIFQYPCKFSDNFISLEYDGDTCWIDRYYVDDDNIKMFFVLLNESIENMKNKGITKFTQTVPNEDWDSFLSVNKKWNIISKNNDNTIEIYCDINDAAESIAQGFGITDEQKN